MNTMTSTPTTIGIVMDGNRRYAKEQGLTSFEGHRQGMRKIRDVVRWAKEAGVQNVITYAFSTENWNRLPEEVAYLMTLFESAFGGEDIEAIKQEGFRVRVIGERDRLPKALQKKVEEAEERTKEGEAGTLAVALSYGGRTEIVDAVNRILQSGASSVDEQTLRSMMWSADIPDPDLIIRTGGDQRLSNFLPWQSVYSELFFTETKWPAFEKGEFDSILAAYGARERRLGR